MTVEIHDPRFREIVGDSVEIEQLGTGFDFTEGPVWHPVGRYLIFSDMPGDHMRRWSAEEGITTFRRPANKANGNVFDSRGRLVTCEHATSRVTRTELDGSITVLATHYGDRELNSPNDIVEARDGSLYFTDPDFGRREYFGVPRESELDFRGVYRIVPGEGDKHEIQLLADDFGQPNGLCFTLDGKGLLVNDTERGHIRHFSVTENGGLSGGEVWADVPGEDSGVVDGMKVDTAGYVHCTGPGGMLVFDIEGNLLGTVLVPELAANFNWGGDDLRDVFVTASTSLYRYRVKVPGPRPF